MKQLLLFFTAAIWLLACSGDCLSCHPALEATILTDIRHKPMLECIVCHKKESGGISECGKDCFTCHPIEKISSDIKAHAVIEQCANCHKKLPVLSEIAPQTSNENTMKSLLFP